MTECSIRAWRYSSGYFCPATVLLIEKVKCLTMQLREISDWISRFSVKGLRGVIPFILIFHLALFWPNWPAYCIIVGISIWFLLVGVLIPAKFKPLFENDTTIFKLGRVPSDLTYIVRSLIQVVVYVMTVVVLPVMLAWMRLGRG